MVGIVSLGGAAAWALSMEHEGHAGGSVAVLGAQLCEISLGVIVESRIAA